MGKILKDILKKRNIATETSFLDFSRDLDTSNIIIVNSESPDFKHLADMSVKEKSGILPVFTEGDIVCYTSKLNRSSLYDLKKADTLSYAEDNCHFFNMTPSEFAEKFEFVSRKESYLIYRFSATTCPEEDSIVYYIAALASQRLLEAPFGYNKKDLVIEGDNSDFYKNISSHIVNAKRTKDGTFEYIDDTNYTAEHYSFLGAIRLTLPYNFCSCDEVTNDMIQYSNPAITELVDRGYTLDQIQKFLEESGLFSDLFDRGLYTTLIHQFLSVMGVLNYLISHPEEKIRSPRARKSDTNKSDEHKKDKTPVKAPEDAPRKVFELNSIRFTTSNAKAEKTLKSRKFERITDCWEVRGHYRHYKNGKTVFIAPYEKGKDRKTQKTGKTYKI